MHRNITGGALAVAILALTAGPAVAQQPNCPPGQQPTGNAAQYCENKPQQGNPQSGNNPGAGNANRGQGNVAGFTATSASVKKLKDDASKSVLDLLNKVMKRTKLKSVKSKSIVITTSKSGFVARVKSFTVKKGSIRTRNGVPVVIVGCVVDVCEIAANRRIDVSRSRSTNYDRRAKRFYLPKITERIKGGETFVIPMQVPKTSAGKRAMRGARSARGFVTVRIRDNETKKIVSRVSKVVRISLR